MNLDNSFILKRFIQSYQNKTMHIASTLKGIVLVLLHANVAFLIPYMVPLAIQKYS